MNSVNTNNSKVNYFERRKVSDTSNLPKFLENDVLFARITPSTENGKTALIENFQEVGIASSELTVLRCNHKILPKYLYYYMKSYRIRSFAISQMLGTTNRQRVPEYVFEKDLNFELPPLSEQQKIASILSGVDATIEATQKIIEKTERLKRGLMQQLLTRGIGHTTFKKVKWFFGKKIEIPEEWHLQTLDNLNVKSTSGGTPSRKKPKYYNGNIVWIKSGELENNFVGNSEEKITSEALRNSSAKIFPKNTVLVAMYGATIGKTAILVKEGSTNQAICAILPNNIFHEYFLQQFLVKNRSILVTFGMGAGQPNINQEIVRNFKYLVPLLSEQQKIASILSGVDAYIQKNQQYKERLEKLKKGLMQKLLTGQIRVKV